MERLNLFLGAPLNPEKDTTAVSSFLHETGEKIVIGGTAVSIFEQYTRQKALVNMDTAADNIPPYGEIAGITAMECAVTLKKFNEVTGQKYYFNNAVSFLRKKIINTEKIKIYLGGASNPTNGVNKEQIIKEFLKNIGRSGQIPEIVDYQE